MTLLTTVIGLLNGMRLTIQEFAAKHATAQDSTDTKTLTASTAMEKALSTETFNRMVQDLRDGETIVANFDTGLKISINYESLTMEDDESEIVISDDDLLQLLRAFLNLYDKAREEPMNINYDVLLTGN